MADEEYIMEFNFKYNKLLINKKLIKAIEIAYDGEFYATMYKDELEFHTGDIEEQILNSLYNPYRDVVFENDLIYISQYFGEKLLIIKDTAKNRGLVYPDDDSDS